MRRDGDLQRQNDRTDLNQANRVDTPSLKARFGDMGLILRTLYRPAALPHRKALQQRAIDHAQSGQNPIAQRWATTEDIQLNYLPRCANDIHLRSLNMNDALCASMHVGSHASA